MTDNAATSERVAVMWDAFKRLPFPRGLTEIVEVDTMAAGCVQYWLSTGGCLDPWRRSVAASSLEQLNVEIPQLTGKQAAYVTLLRDLVALILADGDGAE